jgi:hypothetical protein
MDDVGKMNMAKATHRNRLIKRRGFNRDAKIESRVHCPCELCRLRFGRLLYPRNGGEPLGMGRKKRREHGKSNAH